MAAGGVRQQQQQQQQPAVVVVSGRQVALLCVSAAPTPQCTPRALLPLNTTRVCGPTPPTGEVLPASGYQLTDKSLTILAPPKGEFELQVRVGEGHACVLTDARAQHTH
jgi:hypothetical protein